MNAYNMLIEKISVAKIQTRKAYFDIRKLYINGQIIHNLMNPLLINRKCLKNEKFTVCILENSWKMTIVIKHVNTYTEKD